MTEANRTEDDRCNCNFTGSEPWFHHAPCPVFRPKDPKAMARELAKTMQCNCDLDNWEPERSTGHSRVCRIHNAVVSQRASDAAVRGRLANRATGHE